MRTVALLILVLGAFGGWSQEPLQWLQRALQAEKQKSLAGVRLTQLQIGARTELIRERFWQVGDRLMRVEVQEPASRRGEVFLLREGEWIRLPKEGKVAYVIPAPPFSATQLLEVGIDLLRKGVLTAEQLPDERVANRACMVIALQLNASRAIRPPAQSNRPGRGTPPFPFRVTLWIDRETGLILKREIATRPGVVNLRSEIVRIELNPTLSREMFRLPEGVTINRLHKGGYHSLEEAQREAGFPIRLPSYLPADTQRGRIFVGRRGPHNTLIVAIQYQCPQGRFTLFQAYKPQAGFRPPRIPRKGINARFWQDGDYWFGLVGNLPMAELQKVAESLGYRQP